MALPSHQLRERDRLLTKMWVEGFPMREIAFAVGYSKVESVSARARHLGLKPRVQKKPYQMRVTERKVRPAAIEIDEVPEEDRKPSLPAWPALWSKRVDDTLSRLDDLEHERAKASSQGRQT